MRIDRPFAGEYAGIDPRDMTREQLYDALIFELERQRQERETRLREDAFLNKFRDAAFHRAR